MTSRAVTRQLPEAGTRILMIDDDLKVADAIATDLRAEGYDVVQERTGEAGFFRAATEAFEVILLDLRLPGRSGLEILRALRANDVTTPVLIMTAPDTVEDRIAGLDAGADDYLGKPFALVELLSRVRALVNRRRRASPVLRR
jgi:DNA-binding response OmpR family regulator